MRLHRYEKQHIDTLRPLLSECTVLLKKDGTFPLDGPCKIALYGEGARHTIKGGTGSGDVNSRYFVTVEQGLKAAGFTITTEEWLDAYDTILEQAKADFIRDIKQRARKHHTLALLEGMGAVMAVPEYILPLKGEGDVAVYVLARNSGEGNDRDFVKGDILLTETEIRDIHALDKKYDKFMLVLNVGGPVDLSPVADVKNILVLSQLGVDTGTALADILLGQSNPSGKLATSWAFEADVPELGEFGQKEETRYNEGIYVGYRYYDTMGIKNRFPFGYGLSYTSFTVQAGSVEIIEGCVTVKAIVTNTGERAGKETVQLYVSVPSCKLDQPYQMLAAYAKTSCLKPGDKEEVTLNFELSDLAGYDTERSAYILEAGGYILHLGTSSVDHSICAVIRLTKEILVLQAKPCCGRPDFTDFIPETPVSAVVPEDVFTLEITGEEIVSQTVDYDLEEEIDPWIHTLSDEALAKINIGHFDPKGGIASFIGSASLHVAGAAGETTNTLADEGMPAIVMADGPAGLRLAVKAAVTDERAYAISATLPIDMDDLMPKALKLVMKAMKPKYPDDAKIIRQYTTAIPIGTALAQSFNYDLMKTCGDIVGDEMERFGVHLWLAPALNIHRSMRCGRNFEYYSEDPLVSGLCAAAITEGVQKHQGRGTTIKHYAANNQETARYTNNSQVSERAMREIYLKGFGICVRKAQPKAVMTSYNLLNGTHTSERRDLTQDILRAEFGFKGIVMTDWVIAMMGDKDSPYDVAHASKVAAAGGDLFMPGGKGDYKDVMAALKKGELDRHQLEVNATRVYQMAKQLVSSMSET